MCKRNVGRLDRALRLIMGVVLIPTGLLLLRGWWGNPAGILVAVLALIPLATGLIRFCPAYVPFGISTK